VTITDRLDPISYGLTAEELARYRIESETLSIAMEEVEESSSTYIKYDTTLRIMSKWIEKNKYPFDTKAAIRQRLTNLGVILDPAVVEQMNRVDETALGILMMKIHHALFNRDYAEHPVLEPDDDEDINRKSVLALLITGQTTLDVFFLLNSLTDTACLTAEPVHNPSPPMRRNPLA